MKIRERRYKGWYLGDPVPTELLMEFHGHPSIRIPENVTQHEMERMVVFLATESTHQQYEQDYNYKQSKEESLLEFDSM